MPKKDETTSSRVGSIASRGLKDPGSLSNREIRAVSGAALTNRPDRPAPKPPSRSSGKK